MKGRAPNKNSGAKVTLLAAATVTFGAAFWLASSQGPNATQVSSTLAQKDQASASAKKRRLGDLDVTFLVASDTHLGFGDPEIPDRDILNDPVGIEKTNLRMIAAMNGMEGLDWPTKLGGVVSKPRGVLISGDLTEDGGKQDWALFERMYGLTGKEGPLKLPVFEGDGNHDHHRGWFIREEIARRHGGRFYSFDFDDLHLVCLAEAPDENGLEFLKSDLAKLEADVPVILYFHFPLAGPYSDNWFGKGNYREQLFEAIQGVRILGIFHGHYHASGAYKWRGYDVYNVGSPKHGWESFATVRVTDFRMTVASFNYSEKAWWWWHDKPLKQPPGGAASEKPQPPASRHVGPAMRGRKPSVEL